MLHVRPQGARCDSLLSGSEPLSEGLCSILDLVWSLFPADAGLRDALRGVTAHSFSLCSSSSL